MSYDNSGTSLYLVINNSLDRNDDLKKYIERTGWFVSPPLHNSCPDPRFVLVKDQHSVYVREYPNHYQTENVITKDQIGEGSREYVGSILKLLRDAINDSDIPFEAHLYDSDPLDEIKDL